MAATQVYIDQLYRRGYGRPLWYPEACEVYVGDVGYFDREGNFCRLFNILVGKDDSLNSGEVPENFERLMVHRRDVQYVENSWKAGQCLKTNTVTASDLEFKPLTCA
jgi:hypothetical protein